MSPNSGNPVQAGAEKTLEFFCRHLVALCVTYRQVKNGVPIEEQRFFACPGVVICIRGFCSFLTAGHALKDLSTHLEKGDIVVESAVLADTFGPDTVDTIRSAERTKVLHRQRARGPRFWSYRPKTLLRSASC